MDQKNDGRQPFEKLKLYGLFNPLNRNPTKWQNTLKQFLGNLPTNCLSMFDHFGALALKGLNRPHQFKRLFATNFTLSILKYFVPNVTNFTLLIRFKAGKESTTTGLRLFESLEHLYKSSIFNYYNKFTLSATS